LPPNGHVILQNTSLLKVAAPQVNFLNFAHFVLSISHQCYYWSLEFTTSIA